MGVDIYGWVETHEPENEWWNGTIQIHDIVRRNYGMLASLFGVRNAGYEVREGSDWWENKIYRFRAIAPGRGVPPGASQAYQEEDREGCGAVGETWALWSELATIDWDEEGAFYIGEEPPHSMYDEPGPGRRRERRGDYLWGGWAPLFQHMAQLAEQYGANNVRLSVWFDQG